MDFLILREGETWFLVEAKQGGSSLSQALAYFQKQLGCPHAFQVAFDRPFANVDCFTYREPVIVPARTFFSQLP